MEKKSSIASLEPGNVKMGDMTLHINTTRQFLDLIRHIDSMPETHKCAYDKTRSLYQAIFKGKSLERIKATLNTFFGPPYKLAGKPIPLTLRLESFDQIFGWTPRGPDPFHPQEQKRDLLRGLFPLAETA